MVRRTHPRFVRRGSEKEAPKFAPRPAVHSDCGRGRGKNQCQILARKVDGSGAAASPRRQPQSPQLTAAESYDDALDHYHFVSHIILDQLFCLWDCFGCFFSKTALGPTLASCGSFCGGVALDSFERHCWRMCSYKETQI